MIGRAERQRQDSRLCPPGPPVLSLPVKPMVQLKRRTGPRIPRHPTRETPGAAAVASPSGQTHLPLRQLTEQRPIRWATPAVGPQRDRGPLVGAYNIQRIWSKVTVPLEPETGWAELHGHRQKVWVAPPPRQGWGLGLGGRVGLQNKNPGSFICIFLYLLFTYGCYFERVQRRVLSSRYERRVILVGEK